MWPDRLGQGRRYSIVKVIYRRNKNIWQIEESGDIVVIKHKAALLKDIGVDNYYFTGWAVFMPIFYTKINMLRPSFFGLPKHVV